MFEYAVVDLTDWRNRMPVSAKLALLEAAEPGPEVITALATFDVETLSEFDQVVLLRTLEKARHWLDALQQPVLAAVAGEAGTHDWGREEVAAALSLSKQTADRRITAARNLSGCLTATLAALRAGRISYWHAAHLAAQTAGLAVDLAREVERLALPKALGDGTRPGEGLAAFRRTVTRALIEADPAHVEKQRKAARTDRSVSTWLNPSTVTGSITADGLDPDAISRIMTVLRTRAGQLHTPDDARSHDQRMADAFLDIFDQAAERMDPPGRTGRGGTLVSLVLDYPTFLGLAEHPGWLDGYGPIPADYARELAADAAFRRLLVDPTTGHLLDLSPRTYRPAEPLRRFLTARSRICDGPGCNRPADQCDIDHTIRYTDGGTTTTDNVHPGCGRDHNLRHDGGWKLTQDPDGTTHWTSPTGHTYLNPPWDYRPLE
ncbi:MAG TPA: DUF222 domain-containing protein [Mycobacteriales bacterium]|nr:DUF222 domain-containing protein [Mycobacteriales bacterium]